jgi:hypothetical protein
MNLMKELIPKENDEGNYKDESKQLRRHQIYVYWVSSNQL